MFERGLKYNIARNIGHFKIFKDILFYNGLILKRTYFSPRLMNNVVSVWWRSDTGGWQSWGIYIKGWWGTVDLGDWWFQAIWWIVCKNRRHVHLLFIGGSAVFINRVNIRMAGNLINYGLWTPTCTRELVAVFIALWITFFLGFPLPYTWHSQCWLSYSFPLVVWRTKIFQGAVKLLCKMATQGFSSVLVLTWQSPYTQKLGLIDYLEWQKCIVYV